MRASRIRLIEIIVAVSVVVISVASLAVAVFQGVVMQRTLAAQVIPLVQYNDGNFDEARQEWRQIMLLTNTGLGPAEIRHFQLSWQGEPIVEPADIILRCCVPEGLSPAARGAYLQRAFESEHMRMFFDGVEGRYIAPQETVVFVRFPQPPEDLHPDGFAIWTALDAVRHQIDVSVCYCSVFDECWQAEFPAQTREPVRACPART